MKKETKEQIKNGAKEVVNHVAGSVVLGVLFVVPYAIGYKNGDKIATLKIENGLQKLANAEPEFEEIFKRGVETLKNKK